MRRVRKIERKEESIIKAEEMYNQRNKKVEVISDAKKTDEKPIETPPASQQKSDKISKKTPQSEQPDIEMKSEPTPPII